MWTLDIAIKCFYNILNGDVYFRFIFVVVAVVVYMYFSSG